VFVSIDADGSLFVDRGYVRPEDETAATAGSDSEHESDGGASNDDEPSSATAQRAVTTMGGEGDVEEDDDEIVKPLPDRLVSELTAYRTLALRDAVANAAPDDCRVFAYYVRNQT
jgi:ParB family transcriptional regulator, chromosome partitioning protein